MNQLKVRHSLAGNSLLLQGLSNFFRQFHVLLFPGREFAAQKYQDHRRLTIIVTVFLAILWPALWAWDFVTDPVGAAHTVVLRLLFLLTFTLTLAFVYTRKSSPWLVAYCLLGSLVAEARY